MPVGYSKASALPDALTDDAAAIEKRARLDKERAIRTEAERKRRLVCVTFFLQQFSYLIPCTHLLTSNFLPSPPLLRRHVSMIENSHAAAEIEDRERIAAVLFEQRRVKAEAAAASRAGLQNARREATAAAAANAAAAAEASRVANAAMASRSAAAAVAARQKNTTDLPTQPSPPRSRIVSGRSIEVRGGDGDDDDDARVPYIFDKDSLEVASAMAASRRARATTTSAALSHHYSGGASTTISSPPRHRPPYTSVSPPPPPPQSHRSSAATSSATSPRALDALRATTLFRQADALGAQLKLLNALNGVADDVKLPPPPPPSKMMLVMNAGAGVGLAVPPTSSSLSRLRAPSPVSYEPSAQMLQQPLRASPLGNGGMYESSLGGGGGVRAHSVT